jgi:hypothetical protein
MSGARAIPIAFVPDHLALNEGQLFEVLGLNDGRTVAAKKKALQRTVAKLELDDKWLPGRMMPLRHLEKALATD